MYFCKDYPNAKVGYTVSVKLLDDDGCVRLHPLRSFGERQGDAIDFQLYDCPKLSYTNMMQLVKNYDGRPYMRSVTPGGTVRFIRREEVI